VGWFFIVHSTCTRCNYGLIFRPWHIPDQCRQLIAQHHSCVAHVPRQCFDGICPVLLFKHVPHFVHPKHHFLFLQRARDKFTGQFNFQPTRAFSLNACIGVFVACLLPQTMDVCFGQIQYSTHLSRTDHLNAVITGVG
jgi:hypothetical protein